MNSFIFSRQGWMYLSSSRNVRIRRLTIPILKKDHHCYKVILQSGIGRTEAHLFYENSDGTTAAYLRIFPKKDEPGTLRIGRVLTTRRMAGLGAGLLREAVQYIEENISDLVIGDDALIKSNKKYLTAKLDNDKIVLK